MQPSEVSVVILGQDPYPGEDMCDEKLLIQHYYNQLPHND
jgi:uracil DNA glycosylase